MSTLGVIPARFQSQRFPGKSLSEICGKPMIYWVITRAMTATLLDDLVVATDDERILNCVHGFGFRAEMTSLDHQSGSDRVWEVARKTKAEIIVNIQGDEPLVTGSLLDSCLEPICNREEIDISSLKKPIRSKKELLDPNAVKVVTDDEGFALYFSRSMIPFSKDTNIINTDIFYRHIGIYAYRREALKRFCSVPKSKLEISEKLEQLRGLEAGLRYYIVETDYDSVDVNTPEDILKAEHKMKLYLEAENEN